MRVLHVYSGNLYGGIEAILAALARARSIEPALQHEFALCFEGRLASELACAGAIVHQLAEVRASRPGTVRRARQALRSLLTARSFDAALCHAPWSQAMFGGVVRRAGVPLVFWAHDVMTGRHWTERWARRTAPDLVICNSRFTASTLPRLYPGAQAEVVYAPVDVEAARLTAEDTHAIRESLDTSDHAIVIVQASRSEAWKGHALLLEALAQLKNVPGWVWWQVGGAQRRSEGVFLSELQVAAERAGMTDRVRFVGQRHDVPRLLAAADIHCQPNTGPEPFGIAFVEALAAGLPVVTTAIGGAVEIVDDSCGVLVPAGDALALASALRRMILEAPDRARLAQAAPARARQLCSPAVQVRRLASILAERIPAGVAS